MTLTPRSDISISDALNGYLLDRLTANALGVASRFTFEVPVSETLVLDVTSFFLPTVEVELGYDPRSNGATGVLMFNTYLSSYLYNMLCGYYVLAESTMGHHVGDAADDVIRLNLKKLIAEQMISSHNAKFGHAILFDYFCTGEPVVRRALDSMETSPERQLVGRFFQCLTTDFIFWHEIGHAIYRRDDPEVLRLRRMIDDLIEEITVDDFDPALVDLEEVFCDITALRICAVKYSFNMPIKELVPIFDVLLRFFTLVVCASEQSDGILGERGEIEDAGPPTQTKDAMWFRTLVSLSYLRKTDIEIFTSAFRSFAVFDEKPVSAALRPLSEKSMAWALTRALDTNDDGVWRAAAIASEAIVRDTAEARAYILDVCSVRRLEKGNI